MAKGFDKTDEAVKAILKAAKLGIEESCRLVESAVVALAPVDTGYLADSYNHVVEVTSGGIEGVVGTNTEYAIFVEKGTGEFATNGKGRKGGWVYPMIGKTDEKGRQAFRFTYGQKPQPHLEPGFLNNENNIRRIIAERLRGVKI